MEQPTVIKYWLQRADYTSTDHDPVDVETAIRVVQSHDWSAEVAFERERLSAEFEACPAGVGFFTDSDRILHICPDGSGSALVYYHTWEPRLVVRKMPLLGGVAVIIFALAIWFFSRGGYVLRSTAAVVGAASGFYLLKNVAWRYGLPHATRLDMEVRTGENVPITELPAFIRSFFSDDHQWLCDRIKKSP